MYSHGAYIVIRPVTSGGSLFLVPLSVCLTGHCLLAKWCDSQLNYSTGFLRQSLDLRQDTSSTCVHVLIILRVVQANVFVYHALFTQDPLQYIYTYTCRHKSFGALEYNCLVEQSAFKLFLCLPTEEMQKQMFHLSHRLSLSYNPVSRANADKMFALSRLSQIYNR